MSERVRESERERDRERESEVCARPVCVCVCVHVSLCVKHPPAAFTHARTLAHTQDRTNSIYTHLVSGDGQPGPVSGTHHPGASHEVLVGTSAAALERAPVRNAHTSSV